MRMNSISYTPLLLHIRTFSSISEEEELELVNVLHYRTLRKKEHIHEPGHSCHTLTFVVKGCLRLYLTDLNGDQQTLQFAIENWWISDYVSLNTQRPSLCSIQAVEVSEIIQLDKRSQNQLCQKIPALEHYFRIIGERAYAASQQRIQYIYLMTGEERYWHFQKLFPSFVQRVPQYMLASYLGFSAEFLSKIRRRKAKGIS